MIRTHETQFELGRKQGIKDERNRIMNHFRKQTDKIICKLIENEYVDYEDRKYISNLKSVLAEIYPEEFTDETEGNNSSDKADKKDGE